MPHLIHFLQNLLQTSLKDLIDLQELEDSFVEVAPCVKEHFGHYQSNLALKLAKKLKKNPMQIAEELREKVGFQEEIAEITVTKPGFLNITLTKEELSKRAQNLLLDPKLGVEISEEKKRIIVEFSSPNIAKELHVGHLRSTIIGESIARLFTFLEQDVLRLNHIGDWGTQFGMLIAYMTEEKKEDRSSLELEDLMAWYKAAKKKFDEDDAFKKRSQTAVVSLQRQDPEPMKVWKEICEISRKAFEEIYDLLDVTIQERGESFYNPLLAPMVEDLEKRGIVEISNGAKCIFLEGFTNRDGEPMPFMVQKSDGGFNYDTTDLAALRHRVQVEKADRIIIVTDLGQSLHFQLLFQAGLKAKYYDPDLVRMDHVGFGLVLGQDGKKFKTRSGETKKLVDLIHKAISYAEMLVREKSPELSEKEQKDLAKTLGISAIKYADLSSQRQKDYTFSYERMLRFEGNTAVFLLYSYVRMLGIQRKTSKKVEDLLPKNTIALEHPSEVSLGLHLLRFAEIIGSISEDLELHRLCEYLYVLSEKFNAFFRDCRVSGSDKESERLLLTEACKRVLHKGLTLLGIKTVDRM